MFTKLFPVARGRIELPSAAADMSPQLNVTIKKASCLRSFPICEGKDRTSDRRGGYGPSIKHLIKKASCLKLSIYEPRSDVTIKKASVFTKLFPVARGRIELPSAAADMSPQLNVIIKKSSRVYEAFSCYCEEGSNFRPPRRI